MMYYVKFVMKNGNSLVVIFKKNDGKYILFHFFSYCSRGKISRPQPSRTGCVCTSEMKEM